MRDTMQNCRWAGRCACIALIWAIAAVPAPGAEPLGTAFTYQGRLSLNGAQVDANVDIEFTLWDSDTEGGTLGSAVVANDVMLIDGVFTVELDFGAGVFNGDARWLGIAVRNPAGSGSFTTLSPRQPVTVTPYALHAISTAGGDAGFWSLNGSHIYNTNAGRVGIGTSSPGRDLEVSKTLDGVVHAGVRNVSTGTAAQALLAVNADDAQGGITAYSSNYSSPTFRDRILLSSATNAAGLLLASTATTGDIRLYTGGAASSNQRMLIDSSGNIGVGTSLPESKLHIHSGFGADDAALRLSSFLSSPLILRQTGASLFTIENGGQPRFALTSAGSVGLGTTSPADDLHVHTGSGDVAIRLTSGGSWPAILKQTDSSILTIENGGAQRVSVTPGGNVGIGTVSPAGKAHIDGGGAGTGNPSLRINNPNASGIGLYSTTSSNDANVVVSNTGAGDLIRGFNGSGMKFRVLNDGTTVCPVLQVTGADMAERFPVTEPAVPGTVLIIDPNHPGQLCVASAAYDRRVAGVVSGANGLPAGAILGNLSGAEDAPAVALTGRVWCLCDATVGAIELGDLLTTSATPGHAMKVIDYARAQGAILGKAMTSLEEGKGLVLILVSLQ